MSSRIDNITLTIERVDGTTTSARINESGWMQYHGTRDELAETVELVAAMTEAAHRTFILGDEED